MHQNWVKKLFFASLAGALAGISATIFLYLLNWATSFRDEHLNIIWGLPFAGLLIGWIYKNYSAGSERGNNFILDEIHNPKNVLPFLMAPLVLGGTVVTHLFGGSAGREGTAVQMGASLADQVTRLFKLNSQQRQNLLMAGAGAGFGAAIGAPWAGMIFGMEVSEVGKIKRHAWLECLVASLTAWGTTLLLKAPHTIYPKLPSIDFSMALGGWILLASVIYGLAARLFTLSSHFAEQKLRTLIPSTTLRPFIGGSILLALYQLPNTLRYAGLGISRIQDSLLGGTNQVGFFDPLLKSAFTILTLASGFKGGEFIPLVFVGATLGSALSALFLISTPLFVFVGFAAVFGAAAKTPLACAVMAIELFGFEIAPYALVGCFVAFWVSGRKGIYHSQRS